MTPALTAVEYFAGIGLFRMGLEKAGWKTLFANDISEDKFNIYSGFFADADDIYLVDDVFSISVSEVPVASLATAGFPCIDLSLAGNMTGIDGKHSSAFWGLIRILEEQGALAPPVVLVENVPGWLLSNQGDDFRTTFKALNNLGYMCDVFALDARRFTPQSRLRVFLLGVKDRAVESDPLRILERSNSLMTQRLRKAVISNRDLRWTHTNIPEPPSLRNSGLSPEVVENLCDNDDRWWPEEEVERHLEMMADGHRERVEYLREGEEVSYRTFYRRVRNGQQRAEVRKGDTAGCLRTAVGGSSKQFIIAAGQGKVQMRTMTAREYARLQGVPDRFEINGDELRALTGLGDAVCVPVVEWIASNVLNPLIQETGALDPAPLALEKQVAI